MTLHHLAISEFQFAELLLINETLNMVIITHGKARVSCRASLCVMNHGSISMIRRQKLSQWCGNIHHHLHQRRLRSSSLLKKWCSWFLHHSVACRPKRSDDQCNVLPEGTLLVVCFSFSHWIIHKNTFFNYCLLYKKVIGYLKPCRSIKK